MNQSIFQRTKKKEKGIKAIKTVESKNKYKLKEDRILHLDIQKEKHCKIYSYLFLLLLKRQLVLLIIFNAYMMSSEKSDA